MQDWEAAKPEQLPRGQHERAWEHAPDLRAALEATRDLLTEYARLMSDACGVPDLLETMPGRTNDDS